MPEVVLTTTISVDGRITLGRAQRLLDPTVAARWSTIQVDGAFATRHEELVARAILEGSGSFVDPDAPAPHWPSPTTSDNILWQDHLPTDASRWFVVADGRGRVDWSFTSDGETKLHVLVCRMTPAGYLQRLRDLGVGYFVVGEERVDLRRALIKIRTVLAAERVIADSGGTINASLLRDGLVDILDVVTVPGLIGGAGTPTMMDGPQLALDQVPIRLQLLDVTTAGDAIRARYRVRPVDG